MLFGRADAGCPSNLRLSIGVDGISALCFVPSINSNILIVGTTGGRVRILDCSKSTCETLYQKQWHRSIRCLTVNPFSPSTVITASKQACIKVHDIETKKRSGYYTRMEDSSPFSALIAVAEHRWITGDDDGLVKLWDARLKDGHCFTIKPNTDEVDPNLLGINDLSVGSDPQGTLLAAVDSGCLVAYNIRRRRVQMVSEPSGFSSRSVCTVKNGEKVLLGTDEGVVMVYNWNEFGSACDRFPVRTSRTRVDHRSGAKFFDDAGFPSVEKIVRVTEDIVVIATDDGAISPMGILPNRMLTCLGWHTAEETEGGGGDCMALAVSPFSDTTPMVASGLPLAPSLKFWSVGHLADEFKSKAAEMSKTERASIKMRSERGAKAKVTARGADFERMNFLSGLADRNMEDEDEDEDSGDNDDSESD